MGNSDACPRPTTQALGNLDEEVRELKMLDLQQLLLRAAAAARRKEQTAVDAATQEMEEARRQMGLAEQRSLLAGRLRRGPHCHSASLRSIVYQKSLRLAADCPS
jgi:hypothetical protein